MPGAPLILGGIVATDWQIPPRVEGFGGRQRLAVNKVLGGQRVVDALGPDEDEIAWRGRFRGPTALINAQTWDAMRSAGSQQSLFIVGLYRLVVIAQFNFVIEKPYEIPYFIKCIVVQNPMQGQLGAVPGSLDTVVNNDVNAMNAIASPTTTTSTAYSP